MTKLRTDIEGDSHLLGGAPPLDASRTMHRASCSLLSVALLVVCAWTATYDPSTCITFTRVSTFSELRGAITSGPAANDTSVCIDVVKDVTFSLCITIDAGVDVFIQSSSNAALDGGRMTRLFSVSGVLVLETIALQNGYDTVGGGAVYISSGGIMSVFDSELSDNSADITMHDDDDDEVKQKGHGGVVFVSYAGSLKASECSFHHNSAAWGGAVYLCPLPQSTDELNPTAVFSASGCTFKFQSANIGSIAYIASSSAPEAVGGGNFYTHSCTFRDNSAPSTNGGLIYMAAGTLDASTCLFSHFVIDDGNGGEAGAIAYISSGALGVFTNCTFAFNTATSSALYNAGIAQNLVITNPRSINSSWSGLGSNGKYADGVDGLFVQCSAGFHISGYSMWSATSGEACTSPSGCGTMTTCDGYCDDPICENDCQGPAWAICKVCSAGKYASTTQQPLCASCVAGFYLPFDSHDSSKHDSDVHCLPCPLGFYSGTTGATECSECGRDNRFSDMNATSRCSTCSAGSYTTGGTNTTLRALFAWVLLRWHEHRDALCKWYLR